MKLPFFCLTPVQGCSPKPTPLVSSLRGRYSGQRAPIMGQGGGRALVIHSFHPHGAVRNQTFSPPKSLHDSLMACPRLYCLASELKKTLAFHPLHLTYELATALTTAPGDRPDEIVRGDLSHSRTGEHRGQHH